MISALLYLQYHSVKNRTFRRLKRLKQPKYLFGAIVGGLYFYFYFFRYFLGANGRAGRSPVITRSPEDLLLFESLGAFVLLLVILYAWVVPRDRAALTFTEAETAFLFPAPISRRALIHFKLARSQISILFSVLLLTLVGSRWGGKAWAHAVGAWVLFSTLNLHFLGCSFARTLLLDRGITTGRRRGIVLALAGSAAAAVLLWAQHTLPHYTLAELRTLDSARAYAEQLLASGPLPWILYPFRLVTRPWFAQTWPSLAATIPAALGLLGLHYLWVVRSNVAFEEASLEASRKLADKIAAVRAGNWPTAGQTFKRKRPPFALAPTGRPAVALFWKNLISAGNAFTPRMWFILAVVATSVSLAIGGTPGGSGLAPALAMISGVLILWTLLAGPQFLRQDFRQDLPTADLLKTYPIRGWELALGEVLAPIAILTGVQWLLLLVASLLFAGNAPSSLAGLTLPIAASAALLLPFLNAITLQIPNAAVLLFPAWFQTGKEAPHGIEATGQRIIFVLGQLLVVVLCLAPATFAFSLVFFLARMLLPLGLVIPLAAIATSLVLAAEAALGLMLLGRLFERFDVASDPSP